MSNYQSLRQTQQTATPWSDALEWLANCDEQTGPETPSQSKISFLNSSIISAFRGDRVMDLALSIALLLLSELSPLPGRDKGRVGILGLGREVLLAVEVG